MAGEKDEYGEKETEKKNTSDRKQDEKKGQTTTWNLRKNKKIIK